MICAFLTPLDAELLLRFSLHAVSSVSRWAMPQHCDKTTQLMKLTVHHSELLLANVLGEYFNIHANLCWFSLLHSPIDHFWMHTWWLIGPTPPADCLLWVFCKTQQQWEGLLRPDRVCSIPNSPSMCSWLTSGRPNRLWQEELIYMMSKPIEMHSNTQSLHSVDWLDSYLLQHDVIHVQEVSQLITDAIFLVTSETSWRRDSIIDNNTNMKRTNIFMHRIYVSFVLCHLIFKHANLLISL